MNDFPKRILVLYLGAGCVTLAHFAQACSAERPDQCTGESDGEPKKYFPAIFCFLVRSRVGLGIQLNGSGRCV
jgi:hypothetical protein